MSICDNCIHNNVCSDEGHLDEALTFCADKLEERPQGEWIFKHNSSDVWCSNCDISLESNLCEGIKFSYCPNCSADMRGGGE